MHNILNFIPLIMEHVMEKNMKHEMETTIERVIYGYTGPSQPALPCEPLSAMRCVKVSKQVLSQEAKLTFVLSGLASGNFGIGRLRSRKKLATGCQVKK